VFFRHLRFRPEGACDATPFVCGLLAFAVCFIGLGYSFFPMIVPSGLIIWQAAARPPKPKPCKRALWFATIYAASVVVFAAVAGLLSMIVPN
jgi:cytochrome bd-type quinol oxidase subunit 2